MQWTAAMRTAEADFRAAHAKADLFHADDAGLDRSQASPERWQDAQPAETASRPATKVRCCATRDQGLSAH